MCDIRAAIGALASARINVYLQGRADAACTLRLEPGARKS
jgi:hypothetical protein